MSELIECNRMQLMLKFDQPVVGILKQVWFYVYRDCRCPEGGEDENATKHC